MIKLLLKIPFLKRALLREAFLVKYEDRDESAILKYVLSDSNGMKYYEYIRPELLPLPRYEQMDIRLMEIQSRISRESLKVFAEANEAAARAGDTLTVARLAGELNERLEILYDPEVMMRFICGLLIREDQMKTAYVWNQDLENEKFEQLMSDNDKLGFFFQQTNLKDHVSFSTSSDSDWANLMSEQMVQNQLKQVRTFDQMIKKVSLTLKDKLFAGKRKEKKI